MQAFSSCGEQGLLFLVVPGFLIGIAPLVAEHRLWVHGLGSCGIYLLAACRISLDPVSHLHFQVDSYPLH